MGQSSSVPDTMRVRPHHVPRWALNDSADLLQIAALDDAVTVTGLSLNTSAVRPGDLYIAVPGSRAHGADFVDRARHAGALAVLTDESGAQTVAGRLPADRKSTRLNSSHVAISYAVFCLKEKNNHIA